MAINILIKKTGPYVLSGDLSQVEIADADGKKVDISGKAGDRAVPLRRINE